MGSSQERLNEENDQQPERVVARYFLLQLVLQCGAKKKERNRRRSKVEIERLLSLFEVATLLE